MLYKKSILTSFSVLLATGGAFAADPTLNDVSRSAPVLAPAPMKDWGGGYLGAMVGRGFSGKAKDGEKALTPSGFIGSGFAGYNFQNGSMVYGGETDIGFNGMKAENYGVTLKAGAEGALRARLGYAITDNLLLYTTAGAAVARVQLSQGSKKDTQTLVGWTAGVGADAMLTDTVFARTEYRYTQFGKKDFELESGTGPMSWGSHRIGLGVGVKF
ncbi:outer membrane protein [Nitratireductor sp.]|uniref:outer membrane protein n=1 Tax=Nitratireductor sp. TaxID=1872084 RepID=UPI0025CC0AD7|nr:outer membrane protein [Nitratireductor sp.]